MVRRKSAQIEAVTKGTLLEHLEVGVRFLLHLNVQDFNRIEAGFRRQIDTLFDGEFFGAIAPIGIRGNGNRIAA